MYQMEDSCFRVAPSGRETIRRFPSLATFQARPRTFFAYFFFACASFFYSFRKRGASTHPPGVLKSHFCLKSDRLRFYRPPPPIEGVPVNG